MKKFASIILAAVLMFALCLPAFADVTSANIVGSTVSNGSLAIVVGIASAVVFGLGGFFIGIAVAKKKSKSKDAKKETEKEK